MTTDICHPELHAHLAFVYERSPFYRQFWNDAWSKTGATPQLVDLPVTEHSLYWTANSLDNNQLLTAPFTAGLVFKSGGTTGNPKFSYFSNEDWRLFCSVFGQALLRGGMQPGERVANIFYGGQLYASLLFISRSIEEAGVGVNFPISGSAPVAEIIKILQQFHIETIAGVPTTMMNLLPGLAECESGSLNIKRFLYGGEAMYPDQIELVHKILPGCEVQSIGIAGVDYGEMGFVDSTCNLGVHRVLDDSTVVEIVDDELRPITETGNEGRVVITNFKRRLMPIVRYPVGDRAMWLDPAGTSGRRYQLLGRTEEGARIGPMTLYLDDVYLVLKHTAQESNYIGMQLVIEHFEQKDRCRLCIAVANPNTIPPQLDQLIIEMLYKQRSMFTDLIHNNVVHPLAVEWITPDELITNLRTGKMMRVVDRRHQQK